MNRSVASTRECVHRNDPRTARKSKSMSAKTASEQYRRLAQECLEMVPTIQEGEGRDDLIEMARFWLGLAESFKDDLL